MPEERRYIILSAGQEWNTYSWSAPAKKDNIRFIENLFPKLLRKFWWRKAFRSKLLKNAFWLPFIRSRLRIKSSNTVLIVYDWHPITKDSDIIRKLRNYYPDLHIVYVYTNISRISGSKTFNIIQDLTNIYDKVFAFDKLDSKKYGFEYSRLVYDVDFHSDDMNFEYDIFYVGQAKDRLAQLLSIFKKAKLEGLKCKFYITGVKNENKYNHPDIIYNVNISYGEVLKFISKSKAIVDAIQGESTGMTIKTSEAIMLGKKLITTNRNIMDEPYYKSQNIMIYNSDKNENIKEFIRKPLIPYSDEDRYHFSAQHLLDKINK